MSDGTFYWLTLLTGVLIGLTLLTAIELHRQHNKIQELERLACGFIQEEDGSISPQTNDGIRFKCLLEVGK